MPRARMHQLGRSIAQNLRTNWGVEGPFQWGTIASVTPGNGTTLSVVGVYLDNSASGTGAVVTAGIPYLNGYAPAVGDVVLIARMAGAARSQRVVLACLSNLAGGLAQAGPQRYINNNLIPSGVSTTSTTSKHLGLGSTITITPQSTGRIKVQLSYNISDDTAASTTLTNVRFGTGTAPAVGAAATGSQLDGSPSDKAVGFTSGTFTYSGNQLGVATGLTLGTPYWIDLITSANLGAVLISRLSAFIEEF